MPRLNPITEDAWAIFQACNGKVQDSDLKRSLDGLEKTISSDSDLYTTLARKGQLHRFPKTDKKVFAGVPRKDLKNTYSTRMAPKNAPGQRFYLRIKALADICPYCQAGVVTTLDHVLAKSSYPTLSVTPANLVPACRDCNSTKGQETPKSASDLPFHPYFDEFDDAVWLSASVDESEKGPRLDFNYESPESWDVDKRGRLKSHFETFDLARTYRVYSATILGKHVRRLAKYSSLTEVRLYLEDEADSFSWRANSWQFAAYNALAKSEWYCSGGFRNSAQEGVT